MKYVWQNSKWPKFRWDATKIAANLSATSYAQGKLLGRLAGIGFDLQSRTGLETLASDIVFSAAIEGETLNRDDVRSSVARRMDIVLAENPPHESHHLAARTEMMLDATRGFVRPLSRDRLLAWHAALFPSGYSGLSRIDAGKLRTDREGPMRVVSRRGMLERVHFEAPPANILERELAAFLDWVNEPSDTPELIRVALAHLWFLTLHPFDDGNGRLARAITEYMLARMERSALRFYSLSAQIIREKNAYYEELEHAQRNTLDVTRWVMRFLGLHACAVASAETTLGAILAKADFWREHGQNDFNAHQREMLNRLLDGFNGNLTSSKWAKLCKVSQDTAAREIDALVTQGILVRVGAGRNTHYTLS